MVVVYKLNERLARVIVKGSPDAMASLIYSYLDANNNSNQFDKDLYLQTVEEQITSLG